MTKIQKVLSYGSALATVIAVNPRSVLAENFTIAPAGEAVTDAVGNLKLSQLVSGAIAIMLGMAGIIAFIFLIWGGLQWILSGGDKEGTEKAKKRITAALIGLAIVFASYALIWIVAAVFGIDVLDFALPKFSEFAA